MPSIAASVKAATTMEVFATMESSTSMKTAAGTTTKLAAMLEAFMGKSAASKTIMIPAAPINSPAIVTTTIKASAIEAGMTPIPVIPGPHTDEYAVHKPLRPVVAIRRTGVRIIVVVTIGTNRRWTDVSRANSYANDHPLRAGKRRAKEANAK
jgi:hypothetical protein